MHPIEQELHRRNLETAWGLAASWPVGEQERLAELVVEEFIRRPDPSAERTH